MSKKIQLNKIVKIISGMAFSSKDADSNGTIPVINASSIIAGSTLFEFSKLPKIKELPTRSPAVVVDQDLLMVSRSVPGNPFKTSLVKTDAPIVATSSLYIIRIKNDFVSPDYLNCFFNSRKFQQGVIERALGSTIVHIPISILEKIHIPVPNKNHQKAIIDLNQTIQKQSKINQRRNELKQEIMQAIFTNLYKK